MVAGAAALPGLIDDVMRPVGTEGGLRQFRLPRAVVAPAILGRAAWAHGSSLRPLGPGRALVRSALTSTAMVIHVGVLGLMPIVQVVAGPVAAPTWVVPLPVLAFAERSGPRAFVAVAVGFADVPLAFGLDAWALSAWTLMPIVAGALHGLGTLMTRPGCTGEGTTAKLAESR